MYRKHLKEMEPRTGSKTIDRIAEIPVVNTALANVSDYYGNLKQKNFMLRTSCNLAELSLKTMAFAATPITTICKKPIETVDTFFSEKVDALESAYPILSKPTEVLTTQAKDVYDKKVKQPIEEFYVAKEKQLDDLKQYSSNKVQSVVRAGTDSLDQWKLYSVDVVDKVLENRFAKMFTEPVLTFTEKSLDYWIPLEVGANASSQDDNRTLRRIYDINNRVYKHLYQSTFNQLNSLHIQFDNMIKRLQLVKQIVEMGFTETKDRLRGAVKYATETSLAKQCVSVIEKNNLSLERMENIARNYYNSILTDVTQIVERYMALVRNFPVNFNGSKLRQTIENLRSQLNKDSFRNYLNMAIENLTNIHQALLGYTNQMFQVVNDSRLMQLLNAKSTELKSESNGTNNTGTGTTNIANSNQNNSRKHK